MISRINALSLTVLLGLTLSGCAGESARTDYDVAQEYSTARESRRPAGLRDGDVYIGMPMKDVMATWGEPQDVDTAGDGSHGNERWSYYTGAQNRAWRLSQPRVVYFENGRVTGWQSPH